MTATNQVFFSRIANPFLQSGSVVVFVGVIMLVLKALSMSNTTEVDKSIYWVVGGAGLLFFAMFNSVISLQEQKDMNVYWYRSFGAYAILIVISITLALFLSGVSIDEAGTFRWIYFIITFAYLLFLSLMRFMRKVVALAQKEDNNWQNRMKK